MRPICRLIVAVATMIMLVVIPASASATSPSAVSSSSCVSALHSTQASGTWVCLQAYTVDGVTYNYGDPGFLAHVPGGTDVSVVDGTHTTAAAALAQSPSNAASRETSSANVVRFGTRRTPGREPASARRSETRTFQSDSDGQVQYGYYQGMFWVSVGVLHLYAHININGRQIQNTPSMVKNSGASVDPSVSVAAAGCGEDDFGPEGGYHNTWYPPMQSFYCSFDGTFYNENQWSWTAQNYGNTLWSADLVSATWNCNALFTAPCAFGS